MTLWHASYDLRLTTTAVVAKTVYTATSVEAGSEAGLEMARGLELGTAGAASTDRAELDTSE